jgi:2-polyprenyl-6-methoxyphenol hydroxylase-like FAD-dependent oxidoreductase
MATVERILIVGGGIGGLTLAAALHQHDFRPELIECNPSWHAVGAGIAVQPNGIRILRALGLDTATLQAGTILRYWDFCDQQGEVLCETDLEELWGEVGPFIGIARSHLQQVLLAGAGAVPSRLGISILSLTQEEPGVVIGFSDGRAGHYDLVVSADGIASTVRVLTLSGAPPIYGGQMTWLRCARAV